MKLATKLAKLQPTDSLRYHLHKHLVKTRPARSHKIVHASDGDPGRGKFCGRQFALMDLTGRKPWDEHISTSMQVTFDQGHATAELIIGYFADMGRAVGHWVCLGCRATTYYARRPQKCQHCGCRAFEHAEIRFRSGHGVSCGIDLLVDLGHKKLRAVEIKSIIEKDYKALVAPKPAHRWRSALYLKSMATSDDAFVRDRVDHSRMSIIYVAKGGYGAKDDEIKKWQIGDSGFSPFKEYEVLPTDADHDEFLAQAGSLDLWRYGCGGFPDGVCPNSFAPEAKKCPVVHQCFSGKFPAGAEIESPWVAPIKEDE